MRYFDREHSEIARPPLAVAAAWRGADLATRTDWIVRLSKEQIGALESAADAASRRGLGL